MLFISRDRSPSYVLIPGFRDITPTGQLKSFTKTGKIVFEDARGEIQVSPGLPFHNGIAKGKLLSKDAAHQLRSAGHVFKDEDGKDITERVVIEFLFNHPDNGVEYVAVGSDGEEVNPSERFRIPEAGKGYYCSLCSTHFDSIQGIRGHEATNKEHLERLKKVEKETLSKLLAA